jgi:hypothetical protein
LTIRRERRSDDDGYRSALAPGLRSTHDARHLAVSLSDANGRLTVLATDPPGLYGEVAGERDLEEASWLAMLIAYLGPLDGVDPFAGIRAVRLPWRDGDVPLLDDAPLGPRSSHEAPRGQHTLLAYRRWAERAGSQAAAFTGDPGWTPEQRFERVYERLALPGFHRRARYDLLATLGALERYELRPPSLLLTEDDPVSRAAKRVFGIGDRLTLERRAQALAQALDVPIAALDLGLENWAREAPIALAVNSRDEALLLRAASVLGYE